MWDTCSVGAKWLPLKVFQAIKWAYQGKIDLAQRVNSVKFPFREGVTNVDLFKNMILHLRNYWYLHLHLDFF